MNAFIYQNRISVILIIKNFFISIFHVSFKSICFSLKEINRFLNYERNGRGDISCDKCPWNFSYKLRIITA